MLKENIYLHFSKRETKLSLNRGGYHIEVELERMGIGIGLNIKDLQS